jgi:Novel toxin 21
VRIDRSDPADGPGDAHVVRRAQSAPEDPDAAGKDKDKPVSGDGRPESSSAHPDSDLRAERAAYRAVVDAAYRQYDIDHGHARAEKPERETVTSPTHRIEAEAQESSPVGPDDRLKSKDRLAEPNDRNGEYDLAPPTPVGDLLAGYKSSPALKGDPYHPDSVAARSAGNQELYAATSRDRASALGYTTRIPAQKAPFDSHGQEVFANGKSYITPDIDGHNVTNGWKMFSKRGVRIGTYDSELNYVKE